MTEAEAPRHPLPPFTDETAAQKVRLAEDGWNSRDPAKVALAYTADSRWRNRAEFIEGRKEVEEFLDLFGVGVVEDCRVGGDAEASSFGGANGADGLVVATQPRIIQYLHLGIRFTRVLQKPVGEWLQDMPVQRRIFRDHKDVEAHGVASSQPSVNSSDAGVFFTTSRNCGTSAKGRMCDSPVSSSRAQRKVVS